MTALVVIHVLAAIIGIGPVFFYLVLFRKGQSANELAVSVALAGKLDLFPKIFGTTATVSGIALANVGNYGGITQLWLLSSLVIYIIVQMIVIGMIAPRVKALHAALSVKRPEELDTFPLEQSRREILNRHNVCSFLAVVLFLVMILKPTLA